MAPAGKRKAAAMTANQDFVSNEAKSTFTNFLKRNVILERGIITKPPFEAYIKQHGWEAFTHSPCAANITLSTEFLANMRYLKKKDGLVLCRGKSVPLSPTVINEYYNLPSDPEAYEPYKKLKEELHWEDDERVGDWDDVVRQITKPDVPLEDILKREKWCNIDKKHLTTEMNVWYTFIAARLSPVTINSEVHWERIRLLYAIKKGIKINVGSLICKAIRNSLKTNSGIGFHSLITGLCHQAGVEDRYEDNIKSPMALLKIEAFQRRIKKVADPPVVSNCGTSMETTAVTLSDVVAKIDHLGRFMREFSEYVSKVFVVDRPDVVASYGNVPVFNPLCSKLTTSDTTQTDGAAQNDEGAHLLDD